MNNKVNFQKVLDEAKVKFSYVVPVYKTEKYLKASLESLLNQDYKNIEIIVVADGKSNEAEKIVKDLKDVRIAQYITIPHGGAPKARNEGYKHVTGEYVTFWDSDCYAKPGMLRAQYHHFLEYPEIDFIYSGYRMTNDMFFESEPFDPYVLTCYNYISTMGCMKKDIFPGFDESLESLQDWDMWLTVVEDGHKGLWNPGEGFITEARKGISTENCKPEVWLDRYNKIRNKHNITGRSIAFTSTDCQFRAKELARICKVDYRDGSQFIHPDDHDEIHCVGFYAKNMHITTGAFVNLKKECKKFIHWLGPDIDSFYMLPYKIMKQIVNMLKESGIASYCEDEISRKMLAEVGIDAKIYMLPMQVIAVKMPDKFKIYYEFDNGTQELVKSVVDSCPDIKFESPEVCNLEDYTCYLSITADGVPSENMKRFAASGRYMITNYQLPHAGYVELDKEKIVNAIRTAFKDWKKGVTPKGVEYYTELLNVEKFKQGCLNEKDSVRLAVLQ